MHKPANEEIGAEFSQLNYRQLEFPRLRGGNFPVEEVRQGFVKVGVAVRDLWGGLTRPSGGVPGVPGQPYSLL